MLIPLLLATLLDSLAIQVGDVRVLAPPARRALAVSLAEQAQRPVDWPGLGRQTPPPFLLILAADSTELARLSRGRAPGWGAGVAFPGARTILLRADLPDLSRTLDHEVAHLVLRSRVRGRLPLWFDEGYAAWASGELGRFQSLELNLAVASGRVPTLTELDGMLRGSAPTADLGYSLAASAVAEIARRPPPGALERLMGKLQEGEPFSAALEEATGLNEDRFAEVWRQAIRNQYSLLTWLVAGGMWAVVAFSLGGLLWYRRRRDRPRRAALDRGWVILPEDTPPATPQGTPPAAPGIEPVDPGGSTY